MAEEIEKGDIVKFKDGNYSHRDGKLYKCTDVKRSKVCRSGIWVQVEGTKSYYDSGHFEIIQKFMPIKFSL